MFLPGAQSGAFQIRTMQAISAIILTVYYSEWYHPESCKHGQTMTNRLSNPNHILTNHTHFNNNCQHCYFIWLLDLICVKTVGWMLYMFTYAVNRG